MAKKVYTMKQACNTMIMPNVNSPSAGSMVAASENGVYIGRAKPWNVPFFINFKELVNPHIFITGMTGSGKTHLTRSLMLRLETTLDSIVIVIDFTGEYAEISNRQPAGKPEAKNIHKLICEDKPSLSYFDLSKSNENQKVREGLEILKFISDEIKRRGINKGLPVFVILDEAWKVVKGKRILESLIREGRKYRTGIIIASQMIGDVDPQFLSNIATLIVFKTTDSESLEVLTKNYSIAFERIRDIQNLERGNCQIINLFNTRERTVFKVRVYGVNVRHTAQIVMGDDMGLDVSMEKLENVIRGLCNDSGKTSALISEIRNRKSVRLDKLMNFLIISGVNRRKILLAFQDLHIKDEDIADAFASVIREIGNTNE